MRGKFIVIEGLDGCGKSTQVSLLQQRLQQEGIAYRFIHFPMLNQGVYGTLIAEFLRGEFGTLEEVHPKLVALLFANDRLEHVRKIREWLDEGCCVLADRYVASNIAFQCAKLKNEQEKTDLKNWILDFEFTHNRLPRPDKTFFLNVPISFIRKSLTNARTGETGHPRKLNGLPDGSVQRIYQDDRRRPFAGDTLLRRGRPPAVQRGYSPTGSSLGRDDRPPLVGMSDHR